MPPQALDHVKRSLGTCKAKPFPQKPKPQNSDKLAPPLPTTATVCLNDAGGVRAHWVALRSGAYRNINVLTVSTRRDRARFGIRSFRLDRKLLQELGTLPALEEIIFQEERKQKDEPVLVPEAALDALFRGVTCRGEAAQSIKSIKIDNFFFVDSKCSGVDRKGPWNELGLLPRLESLELFCYKHTLGPILDKVAKVPTLKRLVISTCRRPLVCRCNRSLSPADLETIVKNCTALEELVLKIPSLPAEALPLLLQDANNLRTLKLGKIRFQAQEAVDAWAAFISTNSRLEALEFVPEFLLWGDAVDNDRLFKFLAETLPKVLRKNRRLKSCRVLLRDNILSSRNSMVPVEIQAAWLELVRDHNHVLEELSLYHISRPGSLTYEDCTLHTAFQHNLRLNEIGRGRIFDEERYSGENFLCALESCNGLPITYSHGEESCLYDMLRLHPRIIG